VELKRLNGEVLARFTSLAEVLVAAPSLYERRVVGLAQVKSS
jgi:hypothetical protein